MLWGVNMSHFYSYCIVVLSVRWTDLRLLDCTVCCAVILYCGARGPPRLENREWSPSNGTQSCCWTESHSPFGRAILVTLGKDIEFPASVLLSVLKLSRRRVTKRPSPPTPYSMYRVSQMSGYTEFYYYFLKNGLSALSNICSDAGKAPPF